MNEQCCLGWSDDMDRPSFYRVTQTQCRVPKQCCACGEQIAKGMLKHTIVGVWEGSMFTYIYQSECYILLDMASNAYELGMLLGCSFTGCLEGWAEYAQAHDDKPLLKAVEKVVNRGS